MLKPISVFSALLPILIYLFFIKRNKGNGYGLIFLYALFSFCTDFVFLLLNSATASFYIYSLFTILEYCLFTVFFYLHLNNPLMRKLIIGGSLVFFASALYSIATTKDFQFDSFPASIESILIICYSVLFFYNQLKNPVTTFIYSSKEFWVIVAILLYLSTTLFLFISSAYMSEEERNTYWPINSIANIIKNLLLALSFILIAEKPNKKNIFHYPNK